MKEITDKMIINKTIIDKIIKVNTIETKDHIITRILKENTRIMMIITNYINLREKRIKIKIKWEVISQH